MRNIWAVAVVAVVVVFLVGFAGCSSDGATGEAFFKGKFMKKTVSPSSLKTVVTRTTPKNPSGAKVVPPVCGNRRVERGEQCDDGNRRSGDGCSNRCQYGCSDSDGGELTAIRGTTVGRSNTIPSTVVTVTDRCVGNTTFQHINLIEGYCSGYVVATHQVRCDTANCTDGRCV